MVVGVDMPLVAVSLRPSPYNLCIQRRTCPRVPLEAASEVRHEDILSHSHDLDSPLGVADKHKDHHIDLDIPEVEGYEGNRDLVEVGKGHEEGNHNKDVVDNLLEAVKAGTAHGMAETDFAVSPVVEKVYDIHRSEGHIREVEGDGDKTIHQFLGEAEDILPNRMEAMLVVVWVGSIVFHQAAAGQCICTLLDWDPSFPCCTPLPG